MSGTSRHRCVPEGVPEIPSRTPLLDPKRLQFFDLASQLQRATRPTSQISGVYFGVQLPDPALRGQETLECRLPLSKWGSRAQLWWVSGGCAPGFTSLRWLPLLLEVPWRMDRIFCISGWCDPAREPLQAGENQKPDRPSFGSNHRRYFPWEKHRERFRHIGHNREKGSHLGIWPVGRDLTRSPGSRFCAQKCPQLDEDWQLAKPWGGGQPQPSREMLLAELGFNCGDRRNSLLPLGKNWPQRHNYIQVVSPGPLQGRHPAALCDTCQRSKAAHRKHRAALKDYRVGAPLGRVAVDVMGPLPVTAQGNKYLIVVCDYFTRWVEAFPLPDQKADRVAQTFVHEFVCRFGAPLEVHSDQGRNCESTLFQEMCRLLHIAKTRTTALHPSSNGLVENFNGTLASMIRSSLCSHAGDWDLHIPILTAVYRSTVHSATGFTPNFLMLGRETTTPVDIVFPQVGSGQDLPEYVESLQTRFAECYGLARSHLKAAAEQQRKFNDTRVSQRTYKVGDAVLKQVHRTTKFGLSWLGPFLVKQVINDALYEITDKKKSGVIHHDRLKPFLGELPRWAKNAKEELWRRAVC